MINTDWSPRAFSGKRQRLFIQFYIFYTVGLKIINCIVIYMFLFDNGSKSAAPERVRRVFFI